MSVLKLCCLLILLGLNELQAVPFVDELCQKRLFVSYLVSIYKSNGSDEIFECTGALIHRKFVLSGGSCAAGYKRQSDIFYKAYIRKNDRFAEEHRLITDTIRHPNDPAPRFYGIVLLKLSDAIPGVHLQLNSEPNDMDEEYPCFESEDKVILDWRLDLSSPLGVCYKIDNEIQRYIPPDGGNSLERTIVFSISNVSLPKYQSKIAVGAMLYCSGELYIHSFSYGEKKSTISTNTTTGDSEKNAAITSVFIIVAYYDEFIRETLHKQEPYREITLQAIIPYLLLAIFLVIVLLVILFC